LGYDFAREAGTFVTAEGIETRGALSFVRQLGIVDLPRHRRAQSYFLGRPSENLEDMIVTPEVLLA
jgi:EAL domain-containing protein (putative c-di-GMP-specific phosphodiesterase class I)